MIRRIALLGVGLIGGSLALGLRQSGWQGQIIGYARRSETLTQAQALGVLDAGATSVAEAVQGADLILLAAPLGAYRDLLAQIRPHWHPAQMLTDVGSVKQQIYADCEAVWGYVPPRLVAGHPLAGSEQSGIAAAQARLFARRRVILTPRPDTDPEAIAAVTALWTQVGAQVSQMDAVSHDEILAGTSHLPHVMAYALVAALREADPSGAIFGYGAGALRDVTRIAASDPALWQEIFTQNRTALLQWCERLQVQLQQVQRSLQPEADPVALQQWLAQAQAAKKRYGCAPSGDVDVG